MDGQVEGTGLRSDPAMTSVIARPTSGIQGSFFSDGSSYRTFADTDQIPAVQPERRERRDRGPGRGLAVIVGILAFIVVLAAAALGLVQAGVIGNNGPANTATASAGGSTPAPSHRATPTPHKADLLSQTAFGTGTATYKVAVPAYGLTITSGVGRAWVSVGNQGQRPLFAGILDPHSTQHFTMLGPTQVEIGAGGTSITVTSNHRTQTLLPPSAPFTYTLTTS